MNRAAMRMGDAIRRWPVRSQPAARFEVTADGVRPSPDALSGHGLEAPAEPLVRGSLRPIRDAGHGGLP